MSMARFGHDFMADLQAFQDQLTPVPISPTTSSALREADRIEALLDEADKMSTSKDNSVETSHLNSPPQDSPPSYQMQDGIRRSTRAQTKGNGAFRCWGRQDGQDHGRRDHRQERPRR